MYLCMYVAVDVLCVHKSAYSIDIGDAELFRSERYKTPFWNHDVACRAWNIKEWTQAINGHTQQLQESEWNNFCYWDRGMYVVCT